MTVEAASSADIELIYEAAKNPERWSDVARSLSTLCDGAAIVIGPPDAVGSRQIASAGIVEGPGDGLPWPFELPAANHRGRFVVADSPSTDALLQSHFYRSFLRPNALEPEAPTVLDLCDSAFAPGALVRIHRRRGGRPVDGAILARCNALAEHLIRAYRATTAFERARTQRVRIARALDRTPLGVLVLDDEQRCIDVNAAAREVLAERDGLELIDGWPCAATRDDSRDLRDALTFVSERTSGKPPMPRTLTIGRPSGRPPIEALAIPMGEAEVAATVTRVASALIVARGEAPAIDREALRALYDLTPSEAAFVCAFAARPSLEAAAEARRIRASTARGYMKIAFEKTATNSQHGLLHDVLSGVGRLRSA